MPLNSSILTTTVIGLVLAGVLIYASSYQQPAVPSVENFEPVAERTFESYSDGEFDYEITRYPSGAEVVYGPEVSENITIGFVVDADNLRFGIVPLGDNFSKRFIDLQNLKDKDITIEVMALGEIEPYVEFSQNNFVLGAGENKTVEAVFYAKNSAVGNYTGEIDVVVKMRR